MRNCLRLLLIFFMPVVALAGDIRSYVAGSCAQQGELSVSGDAPLTLQRALLVALDHHPELAVADCEIRAAEGQLLQAGLRPNPELSTEVENFSGTGLSRGFQSTETTLQVRQLIEFGRKRAKRQQLASATRDLSA